MTLLKIGTNSKLGKTIAAFSIPAVVTCPGRTKLCESICYATDGFFNFKSVKNSLSASYDASKQSDFVDIVDTELKTKRKKSISAVRIHPAGDFYSVDYLQKWIDIAKKNPHIYFWAYTRCWRLPDFTSKLKELSELPNVQLWASIDLETKANKEQPPSWLRQADVVKTWDDVDSSFVKCPNQRNEEITCERCTYCFKPKTTTKHNVAFLEH